MMNLDRPFINHISQIMALLSEPLNVKQMVPVWIKTLSDTLEETKTALAGATLLAHPHPDAPICIMTDALDFGLGAVLQQLVGGALVPLAFSARN